MTALAYDRAPIIGGTGDPNDEAVWLHATPDGVLIEAVCEGGLHHIGDEHLVPWADVLKHAPASYLVGENMRRGFQ
jgi:hypothetical protein